MINLDKLLTTLQLRQPFHRNTALGTLHQLFHLNLQIMHVLLKKTSRKAMVI